MSTATVPSIQHDGIYDDVLLFTVLGVSAQTLSRARAGGELRFVRKGQRTLYLGRWVLDWLTADKPAPTPTPTPPTPADDGPAKGKRRF
jgi:hypothetical protein